ncbi:MAG: hypothetical protein AB1705_16275 [Verrucomicrobiota bacterium]
MRSQTMDRRAFIIGLILWGLLLAAGGKWSTNPYFRAPGPQFEKITREETEKAFRFRLASLKNTGGALSSYARRIEQEETAPPPPFDYGDWVWRECRNRLVLFFLVWFACGFLIHWLMFRIFQGKTEIGDVEA